MIHIHTSRLLLLFSIFSYTLIFGQQENLSILFTGDVMQHGPQITGAYNKVTESYEYNESFKFIKPIVESKDIAIANLEITHAGKPYKGYPQFSAPDELSYALKDCGFDVLVTSNNHSCDGGSKGVIRTLDILDQVGIKHTGTFRNAKEREQNYPLILEEKGIRIALLNYTYGTNGLTVAAPLIINYIDSSVIAKDVAKAKTMNVDYIICSMHWGSEYKSLPNDYQKRFESYCYELGVDMIMGGHPHVLQPIEVKTVAGEKKVTAWSMGNFVSNQRDRYKNGGIFVNSNLAIQNQKVTDVKVEYNLLYVHAKEINGMKPYYILPDFDYSIYEGFLSSQDSINMQQFFSDSRNLFAKHNKQTKEEVLNQNSKSGKLIQNILKGYYTVKIDTSALPVSKSNSDQSSVYFFEKQITDKGAYIYTSGRFENEAQAEKHLSFLRTFNLNSPMKIVFINPKNQIILPE